MTPERTNAVVEVGRAPFSPFVSMVEFVYVPSRFEIMTRVLCRVLTTTAPSGASFTTADESPENHTRTGWVGARGVWVGALVWVCRGAPTRRVRQARLPEQAHHLAAPRRSVTRAAASLTRLPGGARTNVVLRGGRPVTKCITRAPSRSSLAGPSWLAETDHPNYVAGARAIHKVFGDLGSLRAVTCSG